MTDAPLTNGTHSNGHLNGHSTTSPVLTASQPPDSPATPIDNSPSAHIKIDVDYTEGESDIRHEPLDIKSGNKLDLLRTASTAPQVGSPVDPASISGDPPKETPPLTNGRSFEDVKMAELQESTRSEDVDMHDDTLPVPPNGLPNGKPSASALPPASSSATIVDSVTPSSPYSITVSNNDDDDKPPPAKRARKYSDAEKASISNTATPPPASVSPPPASERVIIHGIPTFSAAQHRFCASTVRTLKKLKDCQPFNHPVDHVALNIPLYPTIIKQPMDFSTIDRKLASSNPAKPDPNPVNPRYYHADEFIADVRLIFKNCLAFNGPDHPITAMGRRVEEVFDKQIKQMPPPEEAKPPVVKKATPPPPPPPPAPPKKVTRKPSMSVPVIRRSEDTAGRPKREIHPPPPKDLPYTDAPKKTRKAKAPKNDATNEQLKFCEKVIKDLQKKTHYNIAHPFYEPVDWVKLNIPMYPRVIKRPMDLSTMKKKLDAGEYPSAEKFHDDFKLMIRNCSTFNPEGTPVHQCGLELQRLFNEKWKNLPPLHSQEPSDDEDEEEEDEPEDEQARVIAQMESQIELMNRQLEGLKKSKSKEVKETKKKEKKVKPAPVASSSKVPPKQPKATSTRKKQKKPVADDDVLSFDQKKDLSDTIAKLDGVKLERVIQIIHEGVPEIRDSTEEIELEIDQLPANVLTKLYNFVIRPLKPPPPKRSRTGKGTGTGGLKRKSMDEDVEAEKIRVLEERMRLFSEPKTSTSATSHKHAARAVDSDHSSDSSSGSDSSGSDSE